MVVPFMPGVLLQQDGCIDQAFLRDWIQERWNGFILIVF